MQGVYAIKNTKNGKMYIGSSHDAPGRLKTHRRELASGSHDNLFLQEAVHVDGLDAFEFKVIKEVEDADALRSWEGKLIDFHESVVWKNGYNQREKPAGRIADPPELRKTFTIRLSQQRGEWIKRLAAQRFEPYQLVLDSALRTFARKVGFEEKYPDW